MIDKRKTIFAQPVMSYFGWMSRLTENPSVATEKVKKSEMHRPS